MLCDLCMHVSPCVSQHFIVQQLCALQFPWHFCFCCYCCISTCRKRFIRRPMQLLLTWSPFNSPKTRRCLTYIISLPDYLPAFIAVGAYSCSMLFPGYMHLIKHASEPCSGVSIQACSRKYYCAGQLRHQCKAQCHACCHATESIIAPVPVTWRLGVWQVHRPI